MNLILWRHAEAEEGELLPDLDRALTPRGEKQASRMARWLHTQMPESTRILVSPALRCQQTARTLGLKFKLRDELGPSGTAEQVLVLAQWPKHKGQLLLVGHQPWIGAIVAQLLGVGSGDMQVRKGAVWWLRSRALEVGYQTSLIAVQNPDQVTR